MVLERKACNKSCYLLMALLETPWEPYLPAVISACQSNSLSLLCSKKSCIIALAAAIPSRAALIRLSFWDKSPPMLTYTPVPPQSHPLLPTHSLNQRLLSTLPEPAAINPGPREVWEVTDTSVGPEDLSDVAEIARDIDGACSRHPCGLRLCRTPWVSPALCGVARPGQRAQERWHGMHQEGVRQRPGVYFPAYPVFVLCWF